MRKRIIINKRNIFFFFFMIPLHAQSAHSNRITLGFAGDVMLGRGVNDIMRRTSPAYPWGNMLSILQHNDGNIVNLETTLTKSNQAVPKVFNFKTDPQFVAALTNANIKVVNLANNHILDYSIEGLQETISVLQNAHISYAGAGNTLDEAIRPAIFSIKNITIGMIGATDNEPHWVAGPQKPGIFYINFNNISVLKDAVQKLRNKVDIIVVSLHWGPNWAERPSEQFKKVAHELIDTGADIIHGHSAHIFQGIEVYKEKVIMYSTGDFVDDYAVDSHLRNDRSFLFNITVERNKIIEVQLIPTLINNFQVNKAPSSDAKVSLDRMRMLSKELGTEITADGKIIIKK